MTSLRGQRRTPGSAARLLPTSATDICHRHPPCDRSGDAGLVSHSRRPQLPCHDLQAARALVRLMLRSKRSGRSDGRSRRQRRGREAARPHAAAGRGRMPGPAADRCLAGRSTCRASLTASGAMCANRVDWRSQVGVIPRVSAPWTRSRGAVRVPLEHRACLSRGCELHPGKSAKSVSRSGRDQLRPNRRSNLLEPSWRIGELSRISGRHTDWPVSGC